MDALISLRLRATCIETLRQNIGKPYCWGAWNNGAFDCSGIVSFCLGLSEKKCAAELFTMYESHVVDKKQAPPGSLFFYAPNADIKKINHVMMVLEHWNNGAVILAGARGGDSTVTTIDIARGKKAYVDTVWGDYWPERFVFAVDPFGGL